MQTTTRQNIILFSSSILVILTGGLVSPALPEIKKAFSSLPDSAPLIKLILSIPGLFIAIFAILSGIIIDRIGRKKLLIVSLCGFAVFGSAGMYLTSLQALIASRALLGIMVGGILTAATTLIADYYHGPERVRIMGHQSAAMGTGALLFLSLAGGLAALHWRIPFAVYLIAVPLLPAAIRWIREPEHLHEKVASGKLSPVPRTTVALLLLNGFFGVGSYFMLPLHLPFFLREIGYTSSLIAGIALGISTLFTALLSFLYPRIHRRWSHPQITITHYLLAGTGMLLLASAKSYSHVLAATIISGIALGLWMPNSVVWTSTISPQHARGRIIGLLSGSHFFGQFAAPFLILPILHWKGRGGILGVFGFTGLLSLAIGCIIACAFAIYPSRK